MKAFKIIVLIAILVLIGWGVYYQSNKSKTMLSEIGYDASRNEIEEIDETSEEEQTLPKQEITTMNKEGVQIEIIKEGTGEAVTSGKSVTVHYVGTFEDGTGFDSSRSRATPFTFGLGSGQVIKGWDIGVEGMKRGEVRMLTIPGELAYGASGIPGAIPANATLVFEVELIDFK